MRKRRPDYMLHASRPAAPEEPAGGIFAIFYRGGAETSRGWLPDRAPAWHPTATERSDAPAEADIPNSLRGNDPDTGEEVLITRARYPGGFEYALLVVDPGRLVSAYGSTIGPWEPETGPSSGPDDTGPDAAASP